MLEAIELTKKYDGHDALDRLNLRIEPGEVFCLLGANGAGKTTTINLFLNFVQPSSGTARIHGLDVTRAPLETKKYLAYIPEQVMLYRNLTGLENLEYFTALAGHEYPRSTFVDLFRQVGLAPGVEDHRVGTYSKGMRQKVGIAIAIAKEAAPLLLDEPIIGPGSEGVERIFGASEANEQPRCGCLDDHPRSVPRQGIRLTRRHHEAWPPRGDDEHRRYRPCGSRAVVPGAHA